MRSTLSPEIVESALLMAGIASSMSISSGFASVPESLSPVSRPPNSGAMPAKIGDSKAASSPLMFAAAKAPNGRM